ncbi:MAG: hypothetical protein Q9195_009389 [Heterodermia aff. obscurata]
MLLSLVLRLLCFCALLHAREKKGDPEVSIHTLDHAVSNLFYFEDSDIVLIHDREAGKVLRSDDAGVNWAVVDDIPKGAAWELWQHPHDHKVAYVLGGEEQHWVTSDRGESWTKFKTEAPPSVFRSPPLSWHAKDSDKVLFHGQKCTGLFSCQEITYYTKDGFKNTEEMRKDTRGCTFAHSTPLFEGGDEDTVVCVVLGRYSPWPHDQRLVVSDNYFKKETEPYLEGHRTVQGIINIAPVKGFIVAAAKAEGTKELAMYVTRDTSTWHRAVFPNDHKLEEDAYTLLESTNYSIQVDVLTTAPSNPMGVLFNSNSNGTYFTRNIPHTNRNFRGLVDFEKIQGVQGIYLVNVVDNWEEVEKLRKDKKVQSKISFDDGRNFSPLKLKDDKEEDDKEDKKELHLHSVTDMSNVGRVFSSPAPGLALGIGNTGDYLKAYEEGDLWVSDDAGVSWKLALEEAHKYEFGDQGSILVAIYDEGDTDQIRYSLNHGTDWKTFELDKKVRAKVLTTVPDSTTLKFILLATAGKGSKTEHLVISIDFNNLHERKCDDKDFEKWVARLDDQGDPDCLMGHKQFYTRRKADSDCFVKEKFREPEAKFERCTCNKEDFECDYNFRKSEDGEKCEPTSVLAKPENVCKDGDKTFMGSSGFRLIPGDKCDPKGGLDLDKEIERPCNQTQEPSVSGEISHEATSFKADRFHESFYFERTETSTGKDETIIMRTSEQKIYRTVDHGKTWDHVLKGQDITAIYPNNYFNDWVYFLTGGKKVFYSRNRGEDIQEFDAPTEATHDRLQVLSFHADYPDWFIWTGADKCEKGNEKCHSVAYLTTDRGDHWQTLLRYVRKCEFIKKEGRGDSEKLVYCEQYKDEDLAQPLQLVSSDNWFADKEVRFSSVVDFATMSEFIIVAAKDQQDEKSLKVDASVDGKTFADAEFPKNLHVPQKAYTVLDSSTHAVFLHVTVGNREDFEYGSIVKSNSNGTSYVLSLDGVNRNTPGYVDFEKTLGIEGAALVNVVDNIEGAEQGQKKKLKTLISHNDGAEWAPLQAPSEDTDGNPWECDVDHPEKCSLHLHGYTERKDPRDTFSSPTAVGLMMGVGNVGEHLGEKVDEDSIFTFLSTDGGKLWRAVMKGNFMWEYGDQGSIIVIVQEKAATDVVYYSLDEGQSWTPYKFTNQKMQIESISTVPSDNSRNFLLWGRVASSGSEISTVNLDFTGLKERSKQCEFDSEHPESEDHDYYLWKPSHPLSKDDCLFGHVAKYIRKKPKANCYNGRKMTHLNEITHNCSCTRQDYECDYNYERGTDGSCQLVSGLPPPDHSLQCKENPEQTHYYLPTGYRRIPLTTCEGGKEFDIAEDKSCPGHEADWEKEKASHGLSGFWLFVLVVLLPVGLAGSVGYWVYTHWDGGMRVGSIRLGSGADSGGAFDADRPWIKYPVAALAGTVAVVAAVPLLVRSLWRSVTGRGGGGGRYSGLGDGNRAYTTRNSFARRRGEYASVDPDEDELLGEDDEEDERERV